MLTLQHHLCDVLALDTHKNTGWCDGSTLITPTRNFVSSATCTVRPTVTCLPIGKRALFGFSIRCRFDSIPLYGLGMFVWKHKSSSSRHNSFGGRTR